MQSLYLLALSFNFIEFIQSDSGTPKILDYMQSLYLLALNFSEELQYNPCKC
jgi:hypothetical protein